MASQTSVSTIKKSPSGIPTWAHQVIFR